MNTKQKITYTNYIGEDKNDYRYVILDKSIKKILI